MWNPTFFEALVVPIGEYLCADDNTRVCVKMEVARILVKTRYSKVIYEDIEAHINDVLFNVSL